MPYIPYMRRHAPPCGSCPGATPGAVESLRNGAPTGQGLHAFAREIGNRG
jgi:hypothetical protein